MYQKFDRSESTKEIMVHSKVKGTKRVNSLFNFIVDNPNDLGCKVKIKNNNNDERQVAYCFVNLKHQPKQTIFPGFALIDNECHLTVDKFIVSEHNPLSREYSPVHITLVYQNADKSVHYRVHIFYNLRGQIINLNAKSSASKDRGLTNTIAIELSEEQKTLINQEAKDYDKLFQAILLKKEQLYCSLYGLSFDINRELMVAVAREKNELIIEKATKLRDVAKKLSAYNDIEIDGRVRFLDRYLAQLFCRSSSSSSSSAINTLAAREDEIIPVVGHEPVPTSKKQKAKKISKTQQALFPLKKQIEEHISQMHVLEEKEPALSDAYLVLWQKVDELILELELSSKDQEATYIQLQRNQLKNHGTLFDYYSESIWKGAVDNTKRVQSIVEESYNVSSLYFELLSKLEENKPAKYCTKEWVDISEYLFEHSTIFKCIFSIQSMALRLYSEQSFGMSFLMSLYYYNNLPAFTLFLKHCSETATPGILHENQIYNLLQSLILFSVEKPNLSFMKVALESGLSLTAAFTETRIASHKELKKIMPGLKQKPDHLNGIKEFDGKANFISKHAFVFASSFERAVGAPKLIRLLIPYTPIEDLFLGVARILNQKKILQRTLSNHKKATIRCFYTKQECNQMTYSSLGDEVALLFYPNPELVTTQEELSEFKKAMDLCNEILDVIKVNLKKIGVSDEMKRIMLEKFINLGQRESTLAGATAYFLAARLIYIYISCKSNADDCAMINLFNLIAEQTPSSELKRILQLQALAFSEYSVTKNRNNDLTSQERPLHMSDNPYTLFQPAVRSIEEKNQDHSKPDSSAKIN